MTTYATLKTDIADYLGQDDLTSQIATFVRLCEADLRRSVRVRDMETSTTLTFSTQSIALPTAFIAARRLYINADNRDLTFLSPERFYDSQVYSQQGTPTTYTIEGNNIIVAPYSTSIDGYLLYYAAYDALSADSDTNWILTNAYDVYLYCSLMHAQGFAQDDEQAAKWRAAYQYAVEQLNRMENMARFSGSALIRTGRPTP